MRDWSTLGYPPGMSPTEGFRVLAAAGGGQVLRAATAAIAAVRPASKPLHPRGEVTDGTLSRYGATPATGVPWLDEPGRDRVQVRLSRAVGLPRFLPDIHGLAVRVPTPVGFGDVLLASTGTGRVTRFVLSATREPGGCQMTTLLPYRAPVGAVLLGAYEEAHDRWRLVVAPLRGPWCSFGVLELSDDRGNDAPVSFDPVRNTIPGLEVSDWVRRLREPAYRTARRTRGGDRVL